MSYNQSVGKYDFKGRSVQQVSQQLIEDWVKSQREVDILSDKVQADVEALRG
jgi:hypothetical protein